MIVAQLFFALSSDLRLSGRVMMPAKRVTVAPRIAIISAATPDRILVGTWTSPNIIAELPIVLEGVRTSYQLQTVLRFGTWISVHIRHQ